MIELLQATVSAVGLSIVIWWIIGGPRGILRDEPAEADDR